MVLRRGPLQGGTFGNMQSAQLHEKQNGGCDMPDFRRKNIRLPASHYIGRQWYFLTMVAEDRVKRFSSASLVARTSPSS